MAKFKLTHFSYPLFLVSIPFISSNTIFEGQFLLRKTYIELCCCIFFSIFLIKKDKITLNKIDFIFILLFVYTYLNTILLSNNHYYFNDKTFFLIYFYVNCRVFFTDNKSLDIYIQLLRYSIAFLLLIGFLQYLGVLKNYFYLNTIKATFTSDTVYAIYLTVCLPFISINIFKEKNNSIKILFAFCLLMLVVLQIRTAWLCVIIYFYAALDKKKFDFLSHKKTMYPLAVLIIFSMYSLKKPSADSRFYIWKIATNLIENNFLLGTGIRDFSSKYLAIQSQWLTKHPNSIYHNYADDIISIYNVFLEVFLTFGVIGFILFIWLIIKLILTITKNKSHKHTYKIAWSLLFILIASFFSITYSKLSIISLFIISVSFLAKNNTLKKLVQVKLNMTTKYVLLIITFFYFTHLLKKTIVYFEINKMYNITSLEFRNGLQRFKNNSNYLLHLSKIYSENNMPKKALEILASNSIVKTSEYYAYKGDLLSKLGRYDLAIQNYTKSYEIKPVLFYPRYCIAKIFYKKKDPRFEKTAKEILLKKVKIQSEKVTYMKKDLRRKLNTF